MLSKASLYRVDTSVLLADSDFGEWRDLALPVPPNPALSGVQPPCACRHPEQPPATVVHELARFAA